MFGFRNLTGSSKVPKDETEVEDEEREVTRGRWYRIKYKVLIRIGLKQSPGNVNYKERDLMKEVCIVVPNERERKKSRDDFIVERLRHDRDWWNIFYRTRLVEKGS